MMETGYENQITPVQWVVPTDKTDILQYSIW